MKRVKTMLALSYRPVKKLFPLLLTLMFFCCNINTYAQNEPNCNIGKSLTQMKKDFPELRFTKTDTKGDQYMDGYPQDGIGVFFYMKDDIVIEECMIVQSNDGFPRMWYDKWWIVLSQTTLRDLVQADTMQIIGAIQHFLYILFMFQRTT